jgi:hypothetical protein
MRQRPGYLLEWERNKRDNPKGGSEVALDLIAMVPGHGLQQPKQLILPFAGPKRRSLSLACSAANPSFVSIFVALN